MFDAEKYFERIGVRAAIVATIALLGLLIIGDYWIGGELTLGSLYLISVLLITWKTSATMGIAVSMLASALWASMTLRQDGTAIAGYVAWEAAIRLATA